MRNTSPIGIGYDIPRSLVQVGPRLKYRGTVDFEHFQHRVMCHVLGIMPVSQFPSPRSYKFIIVREKSIQWRTGGKRRHGVDRWVLILIFNPSYYRK